VRPTPSPSVLGALVYDVPSGATVGWLTVAVALDSASIPNVTLERHRLGTATIQASRVAPWALARWVGIGRLTAHRTSLVAGSEGGAE